MFEGKGREGGEGKKDVRVFSISPPRSEGGEREKSIEIDNT